MTGLDRSEAKLVLSEDACDLLRSLERNGIAPSLAIRLAAAIQGIRDEFPEPDQVAIDEGIGVVVKLMWANQHWQLFFGAPASDEIADRLQVTSRRAVEGLLQTGLWSLLCYILWVCNLSLGPRDGNRTDATHWAYYLEKINTRIFKAGTSIPTPDELGAALDLLFMVFDPLDAEALGNDDLRRLVQAREEITGFQSPTATLFDWIRETRPRTGIAAEDIAIVTQRLIQDINSLGSQMSETGHATGAPDS
ncbi:hypothetical protein FZO89_07845 [Luteimonas viscosa]|uniref:Uncharacterized protein n=1 Tax=Luteimonas viscosa TaxID=1132694 RepID=A0A5D4XNC7_9GAMM|nr:hypothetical protein [Luteimonas viscosa]TYT26178.1 hypothetical protein FZO89_07845 [Luteimonas viscosa]